MFHQPVLVDEVIHWIDLQDEGVYCDCTVGGAGHLVAMLSRTRKARFVGVDCDPEAIAESRRVTKDFRNRCFLFENNFTNLDLILDEINIKHVKGIFFDLGVSYHQLVTPERGFSFEQDGDLLMRMSPHYPSLREKLLRIREEDLAAVLREYGDVRNYRKMAKQIYGLRRKITTTLDLRRVVEYVVPPRYLKKNLHKVFQALRIWTNNELVNLEEGLSVAFKRLASHGRMLVISYHSGEDRIVKRFFRALKDEARARLLNKKVIKPSDDEITRNPRARSARLRVSEKCAF